MKWLIKKSLEFRFLIALASVILVTVGVFKTQDVSVDILPEFSPISITVQTEALGLSAEEVENLVTVNLEEMLTGTPWVESMESSSLLGVSSIKLTFYPGTDLFEARRMVQENLALASLIPNVSSHPVILQPTSSTNRVMLVGLTSDTLSEIDLSVLARWNITPVLLGVPEVSNVSIWGEKNRQLQVLVDSEELEDKNVSLNQVIETAGDTLWVSPLTFLKASTAGTGGWIDGPNQRLSIRHELPIFEPDDLAKINVVDNTETLKLGDISLVQEGHQPLIGNANVNGKSGIVLVIEKFPQGNVSQITKNLESKLKELQIGLTGVSMHTHIFRPASFVDQILSSIGFTLLVAVVCLSFLFIIFYPLRIALVSIVSLLLTLLASITVLTLFGVSLNLLVIAGVLVSLGFVINMVVRRAETISSFVSLHSDVKKSIRVSAQALDGTNGTFFLLFIAAVVLLLPILFVEGVLGDFYRAFFLGYIVSIALAFLITTSVTAAFLGIFPPKNNFPAESGVILSKIQLFYHRIFYKFELKSALGLAGIMALMMLIASPFIFSSISLFPEVQDRSLVVEWEGVPGTSYSQTEKMVADIEQEILKLDAVEHTAFHTGRAIGSDEIGNINSAKIWVHLKRSADYHATKEKISDLIEYTSGRHHVSSYTNSVFESIVGIDEKDVRLRVYGPRFDEIKNQVSRISQGLSKINGVLDLEIQSKETKPVIDVKVDLVQAQEFGIKPGDVRRATGTLVNGLIVGYFFEDQKVFEVVVQGKENARESLSSLKKLRIETPSGDSVTLEEIAEIEVRESLDVIKREGFSRYTDISFDIESRGAMKKVESYVDSLQFPIEYRAVLSGEYYTDQSSQTIVILLVCIIAFILVLQSLLDGWKKSFIVLLSILLSLLGSIIVSMVIGGGLLLLGSIMGMVLILGLAVNNAVDVVRGLSAYQDQEGGLSMIEIFQVMQSKVVSIIFTALCVAVIFIPFVVIGNLPGHEILFPMSLTVLGGLLTMVCTSAFIVPLLYFYSCFPNNER